LLFIINEGTVYRCKNFLLPVVSFSRSQGFRSRSLRAKLYLRKVITISKFSFNTNNTIFPFLQNMIQIIESKAVIKEGDYGDYHLKIFLQNNQYNFPLCSEYYPDHWEQSCTWERWLPSQNFPSKQTIQFSPFFRIWSRSLRAKLLLRKVITVITISKFSFKTINTIFPFVQNIIQIIESEAVSEKSDTISQFSFNTINTIFPFVQNMIQIIQSEAVLKGRVSRKLLLLVSLDSSTLSTPFLLNTFWKTSSFSCRIFYY
jgi:hypothetical protein